MVEMQPDQSEASGIIKALTPVKLSQRGNKYFNFTLVIGEQATPGVSFESDYHSQFQTMSMEKSPVRVTGIQIKRSSNMVPEEK